MLALTLPVKAAPEHNAACPASHIAPLVLPRVKEALDRNTELTIVAFGSSSTQGWHSTTIAQSYPAVLQAALSAALPEAHVAVINRGIGGQDAAEMVPRIDRDPEKFRQLVLEGVRKLSDASVDVVLMDNQRAPAILAAPHHLQIDQALVDISTRTSTGLFDRGALMDQWQLSGHPYEQFMSSDGVHHNDFGYHCIARALASAILDGLHQPPAAVRSASVRR